MSSVFVLLQRGGFDIQIICSGTVFGEVERNLRRKYPSALTRFMRLVESDTLNIVEPPDSLIVECTQVVHAKDAPIVAAAIHSESQWIATYDERHLLSARAEILAHCNITAARPDEILETLGLSDTP